MDVQDFDSDFHYLGNHIILTTTQPQQPQHQPQKRPPPPLPPLTFLSLPRKVRERVYDYYFTQSFNNNKHTNKAWPTENENDPHIYKKRITSASQYNPYIQLLFTTRQIHSEACGIFYNATTHFKSILFAPDSPWEAYNLITSLGRAHAESCYGQVRVQPNVYAPTGLSVASGYRNIGVYEEEEDVEVWDGGGYFVSVDFLELGLGGCDSMMEQVHVLLAAGSKSKYQEKEEKGVLNVERYLCGLDWHLKVTTQQEKDCEEGEGLLLTGYIGVLDSLCSGNKTLSKLRIRVKRKVLKNIDSRFREIA